MTRRLLDGITAGAIASALLLGCSPGSTDPEPHGITTLSPLPAATTPPPTGMVLAELRQSSRDAAAGRMQIWISNDTRHDITPRRVEYADPRLSQPLLGDRLRTIPSRSIRGYSLSLAGVRCGTASHPTTTPTALVMVGTRSLQLPVTDETDIVGHYVEQTCLARDVAAAAGIGLTISTDGDRAQMRLTVEATGVGVPLTITTISGTPVLGPPTESFWTIDRHVSSPSDSFALDLPIAPARCDAHAFGESGGATAFRIGVRLGHREGIVIVRLAPTQAKKILDWAVDTCGLSAEAS